ncbi:MAG: phosphate signaling complex protein PhoU [Clostridia bacterium]|nr:phosphate signaling complex protein PhoU [Clostridia bacterium]
MRNNFNRQLEDLNQMLIEMGALCETAISNAIKNFGTEDPQAHEKAQATETQINLKESEIQSFCTKLLITQQPVAGDMRMIFSAVKMIVDLERIGDHAYDIASLSEVVRMEDIDNTEAKEDINKMLELVTSMLKDGIDAYINSDMDKANEIINRDRDVDDIFAKVKNSIVDLIVVDKIKGEKCIDLILIAKSLERVGNHTVNLAEWVIYSIMGDDF